MLLFVFQSLLGYRELGNGERPSFTTGNCCGRTRVPVRCASAETSTGKMIATPFAHASSARSIHRVSIFSAFSLPLISPPTAAPLVPRSREMPLGSFYFTALTSPARASFLDPKTAPSTHLTSINNDVTFRLETLRSMHSLSLFICPLCA